MARNVKSRTTFKGCETINQDNHCVKNSDTVMILLLYAAKNEA